MNELEVRRALQRVHVDPRVITPILGGWANWTFELDGTAIVRFPRNDSVALGTHRELLLLPELTAHTTAFEAPNPTHVGTWGDRPFFVYSRINGTALSVIDRPTEYSGIIGAALRDLHAFPVDRAATLLRLGPTETAWRYRYEDLWEIVSTTALPEMNSQLADDVRRHYHGLVGDPPAFPPCLVHNDLGAEHVLVRNGDGAPPVALLDFEDATVGDPAIDFTPLVARLGAAVLPELVGDRDLGDRLTERLWFYRWMGSVHAVIYGVVAGVEVERAGGLAELRRRLDAPLPT